MSTGRCDLSLPEMKDSVGLNVVEDVMGAHSDRVKPGCLKHIRSSSQVSHYCEKSRHGSL
jgi:hypothetical protein